MSALIIAHCRSCKAPIVWAKHSANKGMMPIDAAPSPTGNVVLRAGDGPGSPPTAIVLGKAALEERRGSIELHLNHFATCPDAKDWKRK